MVEPSAEWLRLARHCESLLPVSEPREWVADWYCVRSAVSRDFHAELAKKTKPRQLLGRAQALLPVEL